MHCVTVGQKTGLGGTSPLHLSSTSDKLSFGLYQIFTSLSNLLVNLPYLLLNKKCTDNFSVLSCPQRQLHLIPVFQTSIKTPMTSFGWMKGKDNILGYLLYFRWQLITELQKKLQEGRYFPQRRNVTAEVSKVKIVDTRFYCRDTFVLLDLCFHFDSTVISEF